EKDTSKAFKTVDAEIAPETVDFFVSDTVGDPDCPTDGFSSVKDALATLRLGKFGKEPDRYIEGNIVFAASFATPQTIRFLMGHGLGIISIGMTSENLESLNLPLMSPKNEHNSAAPSFIVTDAIDTSTEVSSSDRAKTILALVSPTSGPASFRRPGHLAGLDPVYVLSTIVNPEDGSIAPLNKLRKLALDHCIPLVLIADLIRYRRKRERLAERVVGDIGNGRDVLIRVHSECLTEDIFGSGCCDCGNQLAMAMQIIKESGRGALIYLRGHEGRGIGLGHKLRAYNLQDLGHDTVEANLELGFAPDSREYAIGAHMLRDIGVQTMRLMTSNPAKFIGLKGYGLAIVERVPVMTPITDENRRYLETKRTKMGHIYGSDIPGALDFKDVPNIDL
nr:monofunctional riboflavin biosynthesis protein RIBA 3, chloroplastic [Tanacetum cinerariifolium]